MTDRNKGNTNEEARRALLLRVAESEQLKRAPRLRALLSYLADHALRNSDEPVHEQEIGCAVFSRRKDYDTNADNIVRASVSDLRKRIEAYFASDGLQESFLLEIPRGSYQVVFKDASTPPVPAAARFGKHGWLLAVAGLCAILIGGCAGAWIESRIQRKAQYPWQQEPAMAAFWSSFLAPGQNVDIVLEDTGFLLIQNLVKQTYPLNAYITRSYLGNLQSTKLSPDTRSAVVLIATKNSERLGEVRLMQRIFSLDPHNALLRHYHARDFSTELLSKDSLILIGNPTSNPWMDAFQNRLNFVEIADASHNSPVLNRSPRVGEQKMYTAGGPAENYTTGTLPQYCVVAYLPQLSSPGNVLLIEGTTSEATEAGGDFLLSESQLSGLLGKLHARKFPHFELLLKVTFVSGSPLTASLEAYRTYPDVR